MNAEEREEQRRNVRYDKQQAKLFSKAMDAVGTWAMNEVDHDANCDCGCVKCDLMIAWGCYISEQDGWPVTEHIPPEPDH